jgi:hypothetical protein
MSRYAQKTIWLLPLICFVIAAMAQEKNGTLLPEPGNVSLTLDEYNRLTELAGRPSKRPEAPPLPYSLSRAALKLHVDNNQVLGTIELDGEVLKKGVVKVPLVTGLTVFDGRQDNKSMPMLQEDGAQTAVLSGPAEFALSLDAGLPLRIEAGRAALSLPVPAAGSATLALTLPGDHTAVNLSPGLITSRTSENGQTTVEAILVPGQTANLWWATREVAAPAAAREVGFLVDVKTLVSVSEAELAMAALVDITVVQGEPAQFEVEIPAGYEITGATGASLESSETSPGLLTLDVGAASQKDYQFLISMETPLTAAKASAPFIALRHAQRETGEVLVEGAGAMELTAREGGSLKRMDVKEVNPYLRALARFSPQAAFRYHKQPGDSPSLELEWVRFPDSAVLAAVAENAEVTTMVTSEGRSLSEIRLTLRNQAQPFLKVELPAGASIVSADVAAEKVKPVEGADGSRVPLLRAGFRPAETYTVSFVIMHSGSPFAKKGGAELSLPKMDIPIGLLHWELFLPERYKVKDFAGDALALDRLPPGLLGSPGLHVEELLAEAQVAPIANSPMGPWGPGQLGGTVMDASGAVVPGTRITVTSADTGFNRTVETGYNGQWRVAGVPSGRIRIEAQKSGFQHAVENVDYDSNRPGSCDISLSVGRTMETVQVQAQVTQVETETSAVSGLNGRNFTNLLALSPGAANAGTQPPSSNVLNLQRRVAGILPVAIEVPHAGTAFHFVRPLVVDEETKVTFNYGSK